MSAAAIAETAQDARAAALANVVAGGLGTVAFSESFRNVLHLAQSSGRFGPDAWAVAVSIELMAVAAVTEIRRRTPLQQTVSVPKAVLAAGVLLSLACNLATARPTSWGYVMAAVPQLAFGAVMLMFETRPRPQPTAAPAGAAAPAAMLTIGADDSGVPTAAQPDDDDTAESPSGAAEPDSGDSIATANQEASEENAAWSPPAGLERPAPALVVKKLAEQIAADDGWRPDYPALVDATGYSRSWVEKRVADARALVGTAVSRY